MKGSAMLLPAIRTWALAFILKMMSIIITGREPGWVSTVYGLVVLSAVLTMGVALAWNVAAMVRDIREAKRECPPPPPGGFILTGDQARSEWFQVCGSDAGVQVTLSEKDIKLSWSADGVSFVTRRRL